MFANFEGDKGPSEEEGREEEDAEEAEAEETLCTSLDKSAEGEEEVTKEKVEVEEELLLRKRKGAPVLSSFRGSKERGSAAVALKIASSEPLFEVVAEKFESLVYASGVRECKNSKFAL